MNKIINIIFLISIIILIPQCVVEEESGDEEDYSDGNVTLNIQVSNLEVPSNKSGSLRNREVSKNITPLEYKISLVNFWLVKDDKSQINIINPNKSNPTYTENSPLIVDFTSASATKALFDNAVNISGGKYTGFKLQFLYLGMRLSVLFHIPFSGDEGFDVSGINNVKKEYDFQLYFNAIGKYWKKDFIVELVADSNIWYWLRREVDTSTKNFFIPVASNVHPTGGAGTNNTIDLFHDTDFWGDESALDDSTNPIIVGTHSSAGGVDASINSFVIDGDDSTLTLNVDVMNTFNFWEDDPNDIAELTSDILDLGPGYDGSNYGDRGLHPFMPKFSVQVSKTQK